MSFGQTVEVFFRSLSIPIEVGFGFREGIGLSGPDLFGSVLWQCPKEQLKQAADFFSSLYLELI